MPLLQLEPFVFPQNLLDGQSPKEDSEGQWWVAHTKPRAEKSLARRLHKLRVAHFLPLYHREWRSGSRLRSSYLPLFPGYVFLHGDSQARLFALETNLIVRTLEVKDQDELEADLRRVYKLVESGSPLAPEDRLAPGSPVEIISGPFAGMAGKILRRGKKLHFFVEVHLLQQGVSVEMESWMFQAVSG
jgi:transcription antitermination factor NusG